MQYKLTIGQLADAAGVTVRAVRHYHATGLLSEPERDTSGYRRYDAATVIDLIRIKTLAGAGVPLSKVDELLAADEDEFLAAVLEIDAALRQQIRDIHEHRSRIAALAAGDSLAVPPEVVDYLRRCRELGLPRAMIELERDSWILLAAHQPDLVAPGIREKRRQIENPNAIELYRTMGEAMAWEPDDPRLPGLVDRFVEFLEGQLAELGDAWRSAEETLPPTSIDLLDSIFIDTVPIARPIMRLLEERGWTGWSDLRPTRPG